MTDNMISHALSVNLDKHARFADSNATNIVVLYFQVNSIGNMVCHICKYL